MYNVPPGIALQEEDLLDISKNQLKTEDLDARLLVPKFLAASVSQIWP